MYMYNSHGVVCIRCAIRDTKCVWPEAKSETGSTPATTWVPSCTRKGMVNGCPLGLKVPCSYSVRVNPV